jgi:hypothetical protein
MAAVVPDADTQKAIAEFNKANPPFCRCDEQPTLVGFTTWWNRAVTSFPVYFIPQVFHTVVLMRILLTITAFSEAFNTGPGGVQAVMALDLNDLYQRCIALFDIAIERTNTLYSLTKHRCTSMAAGPVKKYVDEFFRLVAMCTALLGQAIPEDLLRVFLISGCPAKLRKALLKNPAVRTLDQTKNHILLIAGPIAQNLLLANPSHSEPMELDAAAAPTPNRPRGPLSAAEKQHRKDIGACLYCGSMAHKIEDCPRIRARDAARDPAAATGPPKRKAHFNNAEVAAADDAQGNE